MLFYMSQSTQKASQQRRRKKPETAISPSGGSGRQTRSAGTARRTRTREPKVAVTIRLTPEVAEAMTLIAAEEERTQQFIWEQAANAFITRHNRNKRRREARAKQSEESNE